MSDYSINPLDGQESTSGIYLFQGAAEEALIIKYPRDIHNQGFIAKFYHLQNKPTIFPGQMDFSEIHKLLQNPNYIVDGISIHRYDTIYEMQSYFSSIDLVKRYEQSYGECLNERYRDGKMQIHGILKFKLEIKKYYIVKWV